jgi:hypothetical protein
MRNSTLILRFAISLVLASSLFLTKLALAETATPDTQTQSDINGQALQGSFGRISVNQASGTGNAQANLAVIAVDPNAGGSDADLRSHQTTVTAQTVSKATATISGNAFSDSSGVVAVNQTSGHGNTQVNAFLLGNGNLAVSGLTDRDLSAAHTHSGSTEGDGVAPEQIRETHIGNDAFRGSHGVVQLNQSAGVGNSSANAIVLRLPGGN